MSESKIGLVFPGQGAQSTGMLAGCLQQSVIADTIAEASALLHMDLQAIMSDADKAAVLASTEVTQPVLLAASVAIWRYLQASGVALSRVTALAGHSLGEYSALVISGALPFDKAVTLVSLRGQLMQQAVVGQSVAMAAILGLEGEQVQSLCKQDCYAVNFNSAQQTVIAGFKESVEATMQACLAAGAKKTVLLNVSVPSHCPLMHAAADKLAQAFEGLSIQDARVPIYQNVDAKPHSSAAMLQKNIVAQISQPVLWQQTIENMVKSDIGLFVECGSGKVLSGLIKRITKEAQVMHTDTLPQLEQVQSVLC